jgi:hypothetical protein
MKKRTHPTATKSSLVPFMIIEIIILNMVIITDQINLMEKLMSLLNSCCFIEGCVRSLSVFVCEFMQRTIRFFAYFVSCSERVDTHDCANLFKDWSSIQSYLSQFRFQINRLK